MKCLLMLLILYHSYQKIMWFASLPLWQATELIKTPETQISQAAAGPNLVL